MVEITIVDCAPFQESKILILDRNISKFAGFIEMFT
jgi:hypothetical protein